MSDNFILADLIRRWVYTRQGVQRLKKNDPDFPKPFATYPSGRGNRWREEDVLAYEAKRPELLDATKKWRKVAGFARAKNKGG